MYRALLISLLLYPILSNAQHEYAVFTATGRGGVATTFVTDYHSVGINPANLGMSGQKTVSFGFLESGISVYSDALTRRELRNGMFRYSGERFSYEEKVRAAERFANAPLAVNFDMTYLGVAVQLEKIGGFAFSIRERAHFYSKFNSSVSDIIFRGFGSSYFDSLMVQFQGVDSLIANTPENYDLYRDMIVRGLASNNVTTFSDLFAGSRMNMAWHRDFNLAFGREVFATGHIKLHAGVGIRYIQGIAASEVKVENGKLEAFGAFTPNLTMSLNSPNSNLSNYRALGAAFLFPQTIGHGYGADLGFTFEYKEKAKVGLALINIGAVTYTGNVFTIRDSLLYELQTEGVNSFYLASELPKILDERGVFAWEAKQRKTVALPTMVRFGASQRFENIAEIGVDVVIPVNEVAGNFQRSIFAFGADVWPVRWLRLSSGLVHGGDNINKFLNIPVGFTVLLANGTYEAGVASRDAVTWFFRDGPAISAAFGFLRFRI